MVIWPTFSLSRAKGQHILHLTVDDGIDAVRLGLGQPDRVKLKVAAAPPAQVPAGPGARSAGPERVLE
jgi:hypothetical protein